MSIEINGMGLLLHSYIHIYICMHMYERHYIEKQPNRNQIKLVLKILREQGSFFFFFFFLFCFLFDIPMVESNTGMKGKYTSMDDGEGERKREGREGTQGFLNIESAVSQ